MNSPTPSDIVRKIFVRINESRFWSGSILIHLILVVLLGGTVLFKAIPEPSDFKAGESFVNPDQQVQRPTAPQQLPPGLPTINQVAPPNSPSKALPSIIADSPVPSQIQMPNSGLPGANPTIPTPGANPSGLVGSPDVLSPDQLIQMREFTNWSRGEKKRFSSGGLRDQEFEFVAYLGKYSGGNWNSTVAIEGGEIVRGSLPNLLYLISAWSDGKIRTNERDVKAIALDSDEIFAERPPFIFLTGTRDFVLTEKEVETLRKYIRLGGAIWGDSSVPGRNSRFDIAFRREMKRVMPDVDKEWETIPQNHPIFADGYFPEIQSAPPGLNYYEEPVYAIRYHGEIAILYTANDYGDMWQIGLDADGEPDYSRNARGQLLAINESLWRYRGVYLSNLEPAAVEESFKFGVNVVTHLLTRWDDKLHSVPRL